MKIPLLTKLLLLAVMAVSLSGCIVVPAWDIDGHGGHHDGGHFDGGHHGGHGGHGGGHD